MVTLSLNNSERIYGYVVPDFCIRMYICKRTNHTYALGLFTICATRSASVTSLSPIKMVPFISQIPLRDRVRQFHFQNQRITGNYFLLEFAIFDFQKISVILIFVYRAE